MKLDTFLEKFDQFVDAPNAVERMRGLVKELALQGRLTSQNSAKENATDVLTAISIEKRERAEGMRLPAKQPVDSGASHQLRIPANWLWVNLANISLQIQYGYTASADSAATEIRMLRITDIQNGQVNWPSVPGCQIETGEAEKYRLYPNDILIARTGGTIGKSFIVPDAPVKSVFASYLIRISPPRSLVARYLKIFLESPLYWRQLREMSAGTGQPNVNGQALGRLELPLPPFAEQERIVARVDELMALCERLEAQQKERERQHAALSHAAIARFDNYPSPANLNFLFHPSYSVAPANLRKAVLSAGIKGHLSKHLVGIATWPRVTLNSICLQITDGEHATPERVSEGIPLATAKNIRDGFLDLTKTDWVASDTAERCWRRCKPRHNDLLMVCVGATTGRICLVHDPPDMVLVRSVALIRPNEKHVFPAYLELFLRSPEGQSLVWSNVKQSAQPCLYLGKINSFEMPLPALEEQRHIVGRVNRLMILVNQLDTQLRSSQMEATQLLDAVIHRLLHPTADIIDFSRSEFDRASQRAAIGCYAIEHLAQNPSFGRVMLMKVGYLSETHLGVPLGWRPMRQAAGPWDPWIQDFESSGTRSDWFAVTEKTLNSGRSKIEYTPKKALKVKAGEAITVLGNQKTEFDRLLDLFADKNTEETEIITTLFAAWNDFLIDGKTPTDDEIIHEVRENWHASKGRFSPDLLQRWLGWMRSYGLIPKGHGPRTRQQLQLRLN